MPAEPVCRCIPMDDGTGTVITTYCHDIHNPISAALRGEGPVEFVGLSGILGELPTPDAPE